jgi:hypothetical protein
MPARVTVNFGSSARIVQLTGGLRNKFQVYDYGVDQDFRIDITLIGVVSKSPAISPKR